MFIHRYSINSPFTVNSSLYIQQCGYEDCFPGHHFGSAIRDHFLLHFVIRGKGILAIDNKQYSVSSGQGFLITPGKPSTYTADEQEPWVYYWLGFNGEDSVRALCFRDTNDEKPLFRFDVGPQFIDCIESIIESYGASGNDFSSISGLFQIFNFINPEYTMKMPKDSRINQIVSYIEDNFDTVTLEQVSKRFYLTRGHIFRMFKSAMGVSPQKYLLQFKANRAASLLRATNLSIEQISIESGFGNVSNFARQFKAIYSFSPTQYRNRCRTRTAAWDLPSSPEQSDDE